MDKFDRILVVMMIFFVFFTSVMIGVANMANSMELEDRIEKLEGEK